MAVNLLKATEEFSRLFTGKVSKEDMSKTAKPYYKAMADDIARYDQHGHLIRLRNIDFVCTISQSNYSTLCKNAKGFHLECGAQDKKENLQSYFNALWSF